MKMNKDQLLKHKFWVLLLVAVPLILAGQFIILVVVAGDIDKDKKALLTTIDQAAKEAGPFYSDEDTKKQLDKAADLQKKEFEVWGKVFANQVPTLFWPKNIERNYPIYTGKFLRELKFLEAGATPPVQDDEHHLTGRIVNVATTYIEVQLKDSKKTEKFYAVATEDMKLDGGISFFNIPKDRDAQLTFQTGWYFNDKLTQTQWSSEYRDGYASQIRPILDIVDPINDEGEGVVQLKDWLVPKGKLSELPPEGVKFLRFVTSWKADEDISEECWIAQEDLWIQKEIYVCIRMANDSVGVMKPKDEKLKPGMNVLSAFTNPYFELSLKLVSANKVEYTIKNLLNQRQKLEVKFKVRFSEDPSVPDEEIKIEDEPLEAGSSVKGFKDLVGGPNRTGIHRVEQVLTWETAAIRRIDMVAIGSKQQDEIALNHRIYPDDVQPLVPKKEDPAPLEANPAAPAPGTPPGPPVPGLRGDRIMPCGFPGVAATPNEMTTNLLIKDRYCEKPTEQTRRLPVGVSLIINPEHFDRIMAAFSNSRHRFVVQQLLWNRYPQSVRPNIANGDGLNPQFGPAPFPLPRGPMPGPRTEGGRGPALRGPGPGPGGPRPPIIAPFNPQGAPGGQTGEEEVEPNVELVLYGTVTLYQRYPARKLPKADAAPAPAEAPKQ